MNSALIFLVCLATVSAIKVDKKRALADFLRFEKKYQKVFSSREERALRFKVFHENLEMIEEHNSKSDSTYKMGINQFTDLTSKSFFNKFIQLKLNLFFLTFTENEFKTIYFGGGVKKTRIPAAEATTEYSSEWELESLPKSVDWRKKGIISPVRNQMECGSCWAFATVENVESYLALATGNLTILSPQQLVSCMPNPLQCGGKGGCSGATDELGYAYIQSFGLVE